MGGTNQRRYDSGRSRLLSIASESRWAAIPPSLHSGFQLGRSFCVPPSPMTAPVLTCLRAWVESRDLGAENKAVTDRTFMKFRGPKALTDTSVPRDLTSVVTVFICRCASS